MSEQQVFSFDEEVYKRNKRRRFLRTLGITLFFFLLIILAFIAFDTWGLGGSFLLDQDWRSLGNLISPFFVGVVIAYFIAPNPTPRQTIRINEDILEIQQGEDHFNINKNAVLAIEEFPDSLNVKVGKTTYQLSRDVNNSDVLISLLNQWAPVSNRSLRPLLIIVASLLATMLLCFTSYYFALYLIYWPLVLFAILFAVFFAYSLFRYWTKPPFVNSDRQAIKRQISISLGLIAAGLLLPLFLILYIFILFR